MAVIDQITKAQTRVLDTVVARQNAVLELNKLAAKRVSGLPKADLPDIDMPDVKLPDVDLPFVDQLSERIEDRISIPSIKLPKATDLPAPGELVDNYFAFATKMTKANHQFASKLVDAWVPAKAAPKKAAPKKPAATKATAKKTTPKKTAAKKASATKASAKK